jgi:ComF family protein
VLSTVAKAVAASVRDFIYPPLCFVCEAPTVVADRRVCDECWSSFRPVSVDDPVWVELRDRFGRDGAVSGFLSCYVFEKEGRLQDVIHLLKYRGIKSIGTMLGREIGRRMLEDPTFVGVDYLLPVPLHALKQRERGYNQSEFLCRGIGEVTAIPMLVDVVRRSRYTESQTQLSLDERRENVRGAFEISPKFKPSLEGRTVILVDDVITTGSTITACARELKIAGVEKVVAASVALAP